MTDPTPTPEQLARQAWEHHQEGCPFGGHTFVCFMLALAEEGLTIELQAPAPKSDAA